VLRWLVKKRLLVDACQQGSGWKFGFALNAFETWLSLSLSLSLSRILSAWRFLWRICLSLSQILATRSDRLLCVGSRQIWGTVGLLDGEGAFPRWLGSNRKVVIGDHIVFDHACDRLLFNLLWSAYLLYILFVRFELASYVATELSSTRPSLSSSATELSSMAPSLSSTVMKLSLGGDRALSLFFSSNQRSSFCCSSKS